MWDCTVLWHYMWCGSGTWHHCRVQAIHVSRGWVEEQSGWSPVLLTQCPRGQAQHFNQIIQWSFFHHVAFITSESLQHPRSDTGGSFWGLVVVSSQRDEGFILHFSFHMGWGNTSGHFMSFPSGSRSTGSMSALLLTDVSSLIHGWWYRWKSHDGNVSIHSPSSLPQPNQQNCWNNFVLLEWKRWLPSLSQMSGKPPSPCYIHKERLFTLKTGHVRSCKWDTVHKVTNESLGRDLSLLLAPSLGHFFTNCSLLARHTSFKSILFFSFLSLSLRNCILMDYFTVEILLISYAWFQGL